MNLSLAKLKAILLFFCSHTDPRFLGKTKLMKLFYFLDFLHTKKYGVPVTYDTYINLEHGPIPSAIKNLVDTADENIDDSILADTIKVVATNGQNIRRIVPVRELKEKDKDCFSPDELEILEDVCQRFGDKNTGYLEKISHKEAPWSKTDLLQEIPYTLAAEDRDCIVEKEEIEKALEITGNC